MVSLISAKSQVSNFKADSTNNGNINYTVYTTQRTHWKKTEFNAKGWMVESEDSKWLEKHLQSQQQQESWEIKIGGENARVQKVLSTEIK